MPDAKVLKKIRAQRGFSQEQAGNFARVPNWGRYEQGKRMSLFILRRITEKFGVEPWKIAPELAPESPQSPAVDSGGQSYHGGDRGIAGQGDGIVAEPEDHRQVEIARLRAELERQRQLVCDLAAELVELRKQNRSNQH